MVTTANSACRWAAFVYAWKQMYPFTNASNAGDAVDGMYVPNVVSLAFNRSKSNPANQLSLTIRGPVHWSIRAGNWIVLRSSVHSSVKIKNESAQANDSEDPLQYKFQATANKKHGLPRFIGQITDVHTNYQLVGPGGNMERTTQVSIQEWSSALNIAVRFDDFVIAKSSDTSNPASNVIGLDSFVGPSNQFKVSDMQDLASRSCNAFEFAQIVLRFVGAISEDQQDNEDLAALNYSYPKVAATLPTIPQPLIDDLNITGSSGNGFVDLVGFITGVQKAEIPNTLDNFYGIYPLPVVADMMKSESDGNPYYERQPKYRPVSGNKIQLLYQGMPAWQVLLSTIDSGFNEIFTDFIYTFDTNADEPVVGAQPVIWVRDRPITLQYEIDKWKSEDPTAIDITGVYTIYDQLPQITLDSVFIEQLAISNTFLNSPNFIRINYSSEDASQFDGYYQSFESFGFGVYRPGEMARFGGHEFAIETTYLSLPDTLSPQKNPPSKEDVEKFFRTNRKVVDAWNTQQYKMASANLVLKDPGYPLSVGHNLIFDFGLKDSGKVRYLLGHIETISTTALMDGEGKWHTETSVQLSRLVDATEDQLAYIPIHEMSNLVGEKFAIDPDKYSTDPNPTDPTSLSSFASGIAGSLGDALPALGGAESNDSSTGIPPPEGSKQ